MKTTKLLVLSGGLAQVSAGDTFSPPHMRMGSSAACFLVNIPPSVNVGELTVNGAAAARLTEPATNAAVQPAANFQEAMRIFFPPIDARKLTSAGGFANAWDESLKFPRVNRREKD